MALGTNSAANLLNGSNGQVWSAPYGTALPAAYDTSLDAAFVAAGYITPAGPSVDMKRTIKDTMSWQSLFPIQTRVTGIDGTVKFELQEFTGANLGFAFGGGTLAEPTSGKFTFTPDDPSVIDERTVVVDVHDDTDILRVVFERVYNVGGVSFSFSRENETILPIELKILTGATYSQGVKLLTNIATFEP